MRRLSDSRFARTRGLPYRYDAVFGWTGVERGEGSNDPGSLSAADLDGRRRVLPAPSRAAGIGGQPAQS